MKKLKIIIVGCGRIGNRHAKHIKTYCELVAVCDVIKEKADSLGKEYNTSVFYSIEKLLNSNIECDVIAICTPNGLHAKHSIMSLNKGLVTSRLNINLSFTPYTSGSGSVNLINNGSYVFSSSVFSPEPM